MNDNEFHKLILELFNYDSVTGWFTNKTSRGPASIGARAGHESGHGYRRLSINYNRYYEHHVAWLYMTGEWPDEIDHIDGDGCNNAFSNLRECTRSQNNFNISLKRTGRSGLPGAYLDTRSLQWFSKIQVRGQTIYLGQCSSPEEAHALYMEARDTYAGEFAYENREPQPLNLEK